MLRSNLLWQTLHACEQVEAAFEQTLKVIQDIGHRYSLCSELKEADEKKQRRFEAEIQRAITASSTGKQQKTLMRAPPALPTMLSKKQTKTKKRKTQKFIKRLKKLPVVTMQSSCFHIENCERSGGGDGHGDVNGALYVGVDAMEGADAVQSCKMTYRQRIQRLHEAAHQKLTRDFNKPDDDAIQMLREMRNGERGSGSGSNVNSGNGFSNETTVNAIERSCCCCCACHV